MRHDIMIVGNGEIGENGRVAAAKADFVIRFNECRSYASSSCRTDVIAVCNTGRPGKRMAEADEWRNLPAVRDTVEIWSARDPALFREMREPLAQTYPELDDFCDDYTDAFDRFCKMSGKQHVVIDRAIHAFADDAISALAPPSYVVPSTGLIAIVETLRRFPSADIALTGFNHTGWAGHPFSAERQIVDQYVAAGSLTRYDA